MLDQVELLDLVEIDPPGDAVRDLIDPDKVRELAESIRSSGLLQPILVRRANGRYEVVAGHRRLLAHKLIGELKIKAIVRDLSEEETVLIRAIENDQREDLNPIEKAKVYKRLKEKFGWSNRTIADKMGRAPNTIGHYLDLLDCPDEFQSAIARGRLSMQVALELNKVEDSDFRNYYFAAAVENGITLDVAQTWVNDYRKTKAGSVQSEDGGRGDLGVIQEPLPMYQTCVCCVGPVEVKRVKYIPVCPECESQIRGALRDKK